MPELPEVETLARDLRERLIGRRILRVSLSGKPLRMQKPIDAAALERASVGARVLQVDRRAKYLVLSLSTDYALLLHLGMSGRLDLLPAAEATRPHTHCIFSLDESLELRFTDPRRFGAIRCYPKPALPEAPELRALGPDPLGPDFTAAQLTQALRKTKGCDLKAFLLDQRRIAGLGNIYASEALFAARLHPRARAARLGAKRAARLHMAVRTVLASAVENRGTTFRDYVDSWGQPGGNQLQLQVFMREGSPCFRCGTSIRRLVQAARSTFYCPTCQR